MTEKICSVSELNKYIRQLLDGQECLRNVQVAGEISNFKRYPSGHCYFTLKDAGAVLKCVMFRSRASGLRFEPQDGDKVTAVGRVAVYERDGVYQLYADLLLQQGSGVLMQAYERLKARLEREGLFDAGRKKPLPAAPARVGIITSPAGAAVRDIITVARRRSQGIRLLLYPVQVQGAGAAGEIAAAIRFFNRHRLADVLIVGRGGGSIEDLWAFNEEPAVRAVAASRIPVISAVGHETDFTLCDFAADQRAATPSQAAELAVPDAEGCKRQVRQLEQRCAQLMLARLQEAGRNLERLLSSRVFADPHRLLADRVLRTDGACVRLQQGMEQTLLHAGHSLALQAARLDSLSPLAVLGRGYSVTQDRDFRVISSVEQVTWGMELITTVRDGRIVSVVQQAERR